VDQFGAHTEVRKGDGGRLHGEVLAVDRVGELERDDGEIEAEEGPPVGRGAVDRPPGVGRTEVQPRADRSETHDQSERVHGVRDIGRREEVPDVEQRPSAAHPKEPPEAALDLGVPDHLDPPVGKETPHRGATEGDQVQDERRVGADEGRGRHSLALRGVSIVLCGRMSGSVIV
jgi:hypothetical protein